MVINDKLKTRGPVLRNQKGFSMIELMVAVTISLLVLAFTARIFDNQTETFSSQNALDSLQANGRATMEFVYRSIQNSGYNLTRGRRILAASDRYISVVYDQNNDDVITNDEIITYAPSKPTGGGTENLTISPYFDANGDGTVTSSETNNYTFPLNLSSPPYNFYKYTPDNSGTGHTKSKVAESIDNLVLKYYDKNDEPLPVTLDGGGNRIEPTRPFDFLAVPDQLNDIRRVEIEVLARAKNKDPNDDYRSTGTYTANSIATYGGATTYDDNYRRETFTTNAAPRNLTLAAWGNLSFTASPSDVSCPGTTSTISATLVDANGDSIPSITVNFSTDDPVATSLSTSTGTTGGGGTTSTVLTYDWSSPNQTVTVAGNVVLNINGVNRPVFTAVPVSFQSGTGIFSDNFDDLDDAGWTETIGTYFTVNGAGQYLFDVPFDDTGATVAGCEPWQDYEVLTDLRHNGLTVGRYAGILLRYQSVTTEHYIVRYITTATGYGIDIYRNDCPAGCTLTLLGSSPAVTFDPNKWYTARINIVGTTIQAKLWENTNYPANTPDPNPGVWDITVNDATFANGLVGFQDHVIPPRQVLHDNVSVAQAGS